MQKNKFSIVLIALFFIAYSTNGQVPGYMNKRFLIYYDASFFPSSIYQSLNSSKTWLNYRNNLDAEYVLSRHGSAGATFKMLKTSTNAGIDSAYYSGSQTTIHANAFGLFYKHYHYKRTGCIAPVGYYGKYSLLYYTMSANGTMLYDGSTLTYNLSKYNSWATTYEYGKQTIFFNHLVVHAGAEIGLLLNPRIFGSYIAYNADGNQQTKDQILDAVVGRVFTHMLFNINAGVGWLIF